MFVLYNRMGNPHCMIFEEGRPSISLLLNFRRESSYLSIYMYIVIVMGMIPQYFRNIPPCIVLPIQQVGIYCDNFPP